MRAILFLAGLLAIALASPKQQERLKPQPTELYGKEFVKFQQDVLRLFQNLNNREYYADQVAVGTTYDIEENIGLYNNPQYVREFVELYRTRALPQGEIFSIFYGPQQREAIALYKVLYNAKDLATFYKTACWARLFLNEGLFVYSLSVALVHRPDTSSIVLPPIYEIEPNYFFDAEIIQQAQRARQSIVGVSQSQLPQTVQQLLNLYSQQGQYGSQQSQSYGQSSTEQQKSSQINGQSWLYPQSVGQQVPAVDYPQYWQQGSGQQSQAWWKQPQQQQYQQQPYQQQPYQQQPYQQQPYQQQPYQQQPYQQQPYQQQLYQQQPQQYQQQEQQYQKQYVQQQYQQPPQQYLQQPQQYQQQPQQYKQQPQLYQQQPEKYQQQPQPFSKILSKFGYYPSYFESVEQQYEQDPQFLQQIRLGLKTVPEQLEQPRTYFQQKSFAGITIDANSTRRSINNLEEQTLAYFTEDVGLNAYYYYFNIYCPFWMSSAELNLQPGQRGEQFYFMYQQLLARYYLERLSNGLGEIPSLQYWRNIVQGYQPSLSYPNGQRFPERQNNILLEQQSKSVLYPYYSDSFTLVQDYDFRIREAIDFGHVYTEKSTPINLYQPNGIDLLESIIEGNPDSPLVRFYGSLQVVARQLLGNSPYPQDQYKIRPSVLEQFETSLRDPVFYQFYKRIIGYFQRYKANLPRYVQDDLVFKGVEIQGVKIEPLVTYFDDFYTDVSNALYINSGVNRDLNVRVRQARLNHQPFTYTVSVLSEKPVESVVRVYIGPKYDENGLLINFAENRLNFVEIDRFVSSLRGGVNQIERSSVQSYYPRDRITYSELYVQLLTGVVPSTQGFGLPNRLLLPRGNRQGQIYQLYVMLTPYSPKVQPKKHSYVSSNQLNYWGPVYDGLPLGFPFDREIDESVVQVPNSYMRDILIYNRNVDEIKPDFM